MKIQIVLRNSLDLEISRVDVELDDDGDINLPALVRQNADLCLALEMLGVGDTIAIEETEL